MHDAVTQSVMQLARQRRSFTGTGCPDRTPASVALFDSKRLSRADRQAAFEKAIPAHTVVELPE